MPTKRVLPWLLLVGLGLLVVWWAWPTPPRQQQPDTLAALRASPVTVLLPEVSRTWVTESAVFDDGYRFRAGHSDGLPLVIEGRRTPFPDDPRNESLAVRQTRASLRTMRAPGTSQDQRIAYWDEGGVYYAVTSPDSLGNRGLQETLDRLQPLETAMRGTTAWPGDTPLLYGLYLPLLLAIGLVGAAWLILADTRPPRRSDARA